jgi:hypothetical protein
MSGLEKDSMPPSVTLAICSNTGGGCQNAQVAASGLLDGVGAADGIRNLDNGSLRNPQYIEVYYRDEFLDGMPGLCGETDSRGIIMPWFANQGLAQCDEPRGDVLAHELGHEMLAPGGVSIFYDPPYILDTQHSMNSFSLMYGTGAVIEPANISAEEAADVGNFYSF